MGAHEQGEQVDSDFGQVEDERAMTEEEFRIRELEQMVSAQGNFISAAQQRIFALEVEIVNLMAGHGHTD